MALIGWQQARNILIVDPKTSKQIEHVKAADPERAWLEVWKMMECHPEYKSVWVENGQAVERDITPIQFTDGGGVRSYATGECYRDYDVVNKYTGEVVAEARFEPAS